MATPANEPRSQRDCYRLAAGSYQEGENGEIATPLYNSPVETCRSLKNEDFSGASGLILPRHGLLA